MLLELKNINKSFGVQEVLRDICLALQGDDRIGLLGVNGAGKSTILDIVTGEEPSDSGEVSLSSGATIGYLKQSGALDPKNSILMEARSVFAELVAVGDKMSEIQERIACSPEDSREHNELLEAYDRLLTRFEAGDGYNIDVKIATVLNGMGFSDYDLAMPVANLSGGEKMRLSLSKLLLLEPNLLILDEPTNHLDFKTLTWLEEYLCAYRSAIVVVSHDRYFLDRVAKDICELERCQLTRYKGGYSQFLRQKAERLEFWQKQYERQQQEIIKLEEYVAKNITRASTSNMAKSRVHTLENMERIDRPPGELKTSRLTFPTDCEPYKEVLTAGDITITVGENDKLLLSGINFSVERGEKVALIGQNGVGKSSFLKALMGQSPSSGRIKWGANVKISFFEQEGRQLRPNLSALEMLRHRFPKKTDTELRTLLGTLLLTGDNVHKKIADLSGGERAKVGFALMTLERANVLILDEPTNHLDYKTKEVLEQALVEFEGTIIMVSHDRYLLNRVPSRIVEVLPDELVSYTGDYDYYVSHKREALPPIDLTELLDPPPQPRPDNQFYRSKAQRSAEQKQKKQLDSLESAIEEKEAEIKALEVEIASPEAAADYQKLQGMCLMLEEKRHRLGELMDDWLRLTERE